MSLIFHRAAAVSVGIAALLCAPAILITEWFGGESDIFHISQLFLCFIAVVLSGSYLVRTRRASGRDRLLLWTVFISAGAWLAFAVVVAFAYASTMRNFD